MTKLQEAAAAIEQKRGELKEFFDKHTTADGLQMTEAEVAEVNQRNEELATLAKAYETSKAMADAQEANEKALADSKRPVNRPQYGEPEARAETETKTLGDLFIESDAYKAFPNRHVRFQGSVTVPYGKATFTTSGSTLTQYDRSPGFVMLGQQRLMVADLLSRGTTSMNTIRYPREDTFTNAATPVSEGSLKPEASFDTSEVDSPVRKIAVTAKVSEEMFADFQVLRDYVNARLPFMVKQKEESQLLTGVASTAPNIEGILVNTGIQTQATGTDPQPDAVFKAMTKVRSVGFFEPDGIVIHPNDWQEIRLLRTTQGIYIWGNPSDAGPERIFGLPCVITTAIAENTALVGAFKLGAQVFFNQEITMESTNSNENDFLYNLIAIRAEERLALCVYRPKAFCSITGF